MSIRDPDYFEKFDTRQVVEFFAITIAAGLAFARVDPDQSLLAALIYVTCFAWLSWLMIRVRKRHKPIGSSLLTGISADALMLAVVHFVFAGSGLFDHTWMIFGMLVTPVLHALIAGWLLHRKAEAIEALHDTLNTFQGNLDELKFMRSRFWCYVRLHAWTSHQVFDDLCICDRCTKIAKHRWRGDHCSRCGAARGDAAE